MKRVYQVDDYDLYIANSEKEALEMAMDLTGCTLDDYNNGDDCFSLSFKLLRKLSFHYDEEDTSKTRPMLAQIVLMMLTGKWEIGFFASSEF